MSISDFQVSSWLSDLGQLYLGLAFDNPDIAGAYACEVFGASYTRLLCPMTQPSGRAIWNINQLIFTGLPNVTITHLVAWDAPINGNYVASAELTSPDSADPAPVKISLGKSFSVDPLTFVISLS